VPILIDGHNLIGQLGTISLQDPEDEEKLVELLRSYQARTGKTITVVFDPGGGFALPWSGYSGSVEVLFAPHGGSADALIIRRVRQSRQPGEWLVVTSDRELGRAAMQSGARVQTAEAFAADLERPQETDSESKDVLLSPEEVAAWLTLFEERD
jgi:predicted RNA-binding protein with PIN domain